MLGTHATRRVQSRVVFSRETFFGEAGFANVSACHVVVVGIGGLAPMRLACLCDRG